MLQWLFFTGHGRSGIQWLVSWEGDAFAPAFGVAQVFENATQGAKQCKTPRTPLRIAGFTYDDLVFLPGLPAFEESEVDLSGLVTKNIRLGLNLWRATTLRLTTPVLASPSDTVTGPKMAIEMALAGGMGIIHANQSIEKQVQMVQTVKRFVSGFILEPFVMGPTQSLADLDALKEVKGISSVPITSDGQLGGRLVGIVSSRDADRCEDRTEFLCRASSLKILKDRI